MAVNQTKIYKHQYLINIAESAEWPANDMPPERLLSIPFLNPHDNHVINSPVGSESPYFRSYKYGLSKHPHNDAVEMLKKEPQLVDLRGIIKNPNPKIASLLEQYLEQFEHTHWLTMCRSNHKVILEFLEKHTDKIDNDNWRQLSGNEHEIAIRILQNNPHKINFEILSGNPSGFEIMKQHMDLINWNYFAGNKHPDAIRVIEQNLQLVCTDTYLLGSPWQMNYCMLSSNPNAFHILLENPHFINFGSLLYNPSESALAYIEANITQINTIHIAYLVENPNGLMLIEKLLKQGQITQNAVLNFYPELVMNEAFFEVDLDYQEMSKKRSKIIYSELMEKALHPSRVYKWVEYHYENGGTAANLEM
jgi:hypothetical protein